MTKDIMRIRRHIAITSFVCIILTLFSVLLMIFFGNKELANNMLSATGIISPIILALTGIIAQYAHTSSQHDKIKINQGEIHDRTE